MIQVQQNKAAEKINTC